MDWEALFRASTSRLQASLDEARAAVEHRTIKGHLNEIAVANWIRPLLPGSVGVTTGEVIDSEGGRSRQVDVLLYDIATTSRFLSRGDADVLPIESVYGAIEVKTYLNKAEIENAFENMKAIKALKKIAYHPNFVSTTKYLYGRESMYWPQQFFVFAYESDGLDTVLGHVERLNNTQPIDQRIDLVCILDKGLIINLAPEGLQPIPMPNTKLIAKPSSKALLTFYSVLGHLMGQAVSEPIAMHAYLKHLQH
ncbi:DUF6602 domain-containing protein [Chromobacterium violaceum]|uniref:DUF6602 domain-containing protein n=1 Tax=Chromobacterium violaceum (strain ATCC 12472 / DSM 30191 / JCM 1249 / CCUG 213 / NBRC 12614 / NCIMB 9131 / NCTC 9757 / MK) TaxID=243365 RepID=Q7NU75_CHRVO|nr:DUF6602 domain-containing protein [Chromobacterium violaceum]AAQ60496.1 hypothetical protein CV_2828 [Chromobacterium violaceum ATCC 12472]SUX36019.1 Uncharacterised protein [Chromobacterium violaceum]